jgi:hypothetical protein
MFNICILTIIYKLFVIFMEVSAIFKEVFNKEKYDNGYLCINCAVNVKEYHYRP